MEKFFISFTISIFDTCIYYTFLHLTFIRTYPPSFLPTQPQLHVPAFLILFSSHVLYIFHPSIACYITGYLDLFTKCKERDLSESYELASPSRVRRDDREREENPGIPKCLLDQIQLKKRICQEVKWVGEVMSLVLSSRKKKKEILLPKARFQLQPAPVNIDTTYCHLHPAQYASLPAKLSSH